MGQFIKDAALKTAARTPRCPGSSGSWALAIPGTPAAAALSPEQAEPAPVRSLSCPGPSDLRTCSLSPLLGGD